MVSNTLELSDFFENEVVLPGQFFDKGLRIKETELYLAVLQTAVHDYEKYKHAKKPRERALFEDAKAWLFQEEDSNWPFSFVSVCAVIGMNPEYLRRGIKQNEKHGI